MLRSLATLLLLQVATAVGAFAMMADTPGLVVAKGRFLLRTGDNSVLQGTELKGLILKVQGEAGAVEIRIDGVEDGPYSDLELYNFAVRDGAAGAWRPFCNPGQDGRALGFPLLAPVDGLTSSEEKFSIACTAGAQGKCVMRGYRPWAVTPDGQSLEPFFEACVRMMRADYCGDGTSYTRAGIRVSSWDRLGLQNDNALPFEAAWGPKGAVCLSRVREPKITTLKDLLSQCPALAARVHDDCGARTAGEGSDALIWNGAPQQ